MVSLPSLFTPLSPPSLLGSSLKLHALKSWVKVRFWETQAETTCYPCCGYSSCFVLHSPVITSIGPWMSVFWYSTYLFRGHMRVSSSASETRLEKGPRCCPRESSFKLNMCCTKMHPMKTHPTMHPLHFPSAYLSPYNSFDQNFQHVGHNMIILHDTWYANVILNHTESLDFVIERQFPFSLLFLWFGPALNIL